LNLQEKLLELGNELAHEKGEDTDGWDADDFISFLLEAADWRSVLRASWSGGSFAGIQEWRGLYYAFDDAETYGPYDSFREARSKLQLSAGYDKVVERWVSSEYAAEDHDRTSRRRNEA
jgi:hypothetical protein